MIVSWLNKVFTNKPFAFVVLLLSLLSHGLVIFAIIIKWNDIVLPFPVECIFCLGLSALFNISAFLVPQVLHFRIIHGIRFLFILLVVLILDGVTIVIPVLLLLPLLAETVIYDGKRLALWVNSIFIILIGIVLVVQLQENGFYSTLVSALIYITVTGLSFGFFWFAILYRESLVDSNSRISNLYTTVMNLSDANLAFQLYAESIETESADKERSRITRELHDTVGYTLTNIIVMMNAAKVLLDKDPGALPDLFDQMGEQSESALNEIRQILYQLRNFKSYRPQGLKAIYHLIESFDRATGTDVQLSTGNLPWSLGQKLDTVLMRFVQEGLTNSFRHGKATQVHISMWRDIDEISLCIWDNGKGIVDENQFQEGLGLTGMKERFDALGGMVFLKNVIDGFELRGTIPYKIGDFFGKD